jgi:hypothetical protein
MQKCGIKIAQTCHGVNFEWKGGGGGAFLGVFVRYESRFEGGWCFGIFEGFD